MNGVLKLKLVLWNGILPNVSAQSGTIEPAKKTVSFCCKDYADGFKNDPGKYLRDEEQREEKS
ncbi:MAG: hypothetical protein ACK41Q_06450 [Candidatus Brocadia sp.]